MRLSVVLSTHPAQFRAVAYQGDLETNVAKVASWGYDGVELAIRDPALVDPEVLAALVQRHGLQVPAIGTGQAWGEEGLSYTDPDPAVRAAAVRRTVAHVPFAARTGALIVIGLLRGIVRPEVERARAMEWLEAALREACAAARREGVRVVLEPLNRYETTLVNNVAEGLELIERVGAPNLGLLLDTYHMNIEEPSIEGSIFASRSRVWHVHVADSNRRRPGAGHLDFRAICAALEGAGYEGWISGEFLPLPDADTAAQRCVQYLRVLEMAA